MYLVKILMFLFVINLTVNNLFCNNNNQNFINIKKNNNVDNYKIPQIKPYRPKIDSYNSKPKFDSHNNGYGSFSEKTGRLKTNPVSPHVRKNGTYINPYYRS